MEKFEVFGISGDKHYTLEDLFDIERNDDEEVVAISKEVFEHDEEDLKFKYQYVIEAVWCDGDIYYNLELVPTPESLCKKKFDSVLSCSGIEPEDCTIADVHSYGLGIMFGNTKTEGEEIKQDVLDAIANTLDIFNRIWFGYSLDLAKNRLGTTGWDLLQEYINGADAFQFTYDRYNKEKEC